MMGKSKNETAEQRQTRLEYNRKWNRANREEERRKRKERYYLWQKDVQISEYMIKRLEVLDRMGGKCKACGATDESVLAIDHVKNDGASERRNESYLIGRLYKDPAIPVDRYQLLCHNCNHKKRRFGDDPTKWPQKTVKERIEEIKNTAISMAEAREIAKSIR